MGAKRKPLFAIFTMWICLTKSKMSSKRYVWIRARHRKVPTAKMSSRPFSKQLQHLLTGWYIFALANSKESVMPNLFFNAITDVLRQLFTFIIPVSGSPVNKNGTVWVAPAPYPPASSGTGEPAPSEDIRQSPVLPPHHSQVYQKYFPINLLSSYI